MYCPVASAACHNISLIQSGCSRTAPRITLAGARTSCVPGQARGVALALIAAVVLAGCDRLPETYAPPEQRHPVEDFNPPPESTMVEMSDPNPDPRILKDVYGPSSPSWRWTGQNPTVRVFPLATDHLKFIADFSIWEEGFKSTGPLEIAYLVNNQILEKVRYATPGVKHYEKAVPPDWLPKDSATTLAMWVDKLYVSPHDGMKFGVILVRLGLKP
jgi:hypothetical protein